MKTARIISGPGADLLQPIVEQGLASSGWQVVHGTALSEPAAELFLALNLSLQDFAAACRLAVTVHPPGRTGLAVQITSGQHGDELPSALPAALAASNRDFRQLALECAPRLRLNAIAAVSAGDAGALAGEILAAVMLFVECPAMTGAIIGIDLPRAKQAAATQA